VPVLRRAFGVRADNDETIGYLRQSFNELRGHAWDGAAFDDVVVRLATAYTSLSAPMRDSLLPRIRTYPSAQLQNVLLGDDAPTRALQPLADALGGRVGDAGLQLQAALTALRQQWRDDAAAQPPPVRRRRLQ
jgi:hypothetical protein